MTLVTTADLSQSFKSSQSVYTHNVNNQIKTLHLCIVYWSKHIPITKINTWAWKNCQNDSGLFSSALHSLWNEYDTNWCLQAPGNSLPEFRIWWSLDDKCAIHLNNYICLRLPRKGYFIDILWKFISTLQ